MLLAACSTSGPTSPTTPQIYFPPLSGPSRTFTFDRDVSYPVRDYTRQSRFKLYENGALELQYPASSSLAAFSYRGAYQRDASGVLAILFEFQGRSVGTPWNDATATLEGDSLTVLYPWDMRMADFEDAVYVLRP